MDDSMPPGAVILPPDSFGCPTLSDGEESTTSERDLAGEAPAQPRIINSSRDNNSTSVFFPTSNVYISRCLFAWLWRSATKFRNTWSFLSEKGFKISELRRQLQNPKDIQYRAAGLFPTEPCANLCGTCQKVVDEFNSLRWYRTAVTGINFRKTGDTRRNIVGRLLDRLATIATSPQPTICLCNFLGTVCTITGNDPTHASFTFFHPDYHFDTGTVAVALSLTNQMGWQDRNTRVRHLPVMYHEHQGMHNLIPRFLGPQVDFDVVKQWISHCCSHHQKTCLSDTTRVAKIPGFRLVECSSRRLVEVSEITETDKLQFIALSYVWGSKDASDIPPRDGLPAQMSKVIDDAITAAQCMGFEYLWVDRYCIPQDNPEAKHCQIKSMNIIYECATVTIVAAAGDDPSCGLPGVASTRRVPQEFVNIKPGTFVLLHHDIDYQLSQTRWDTRAWTFQEGLLSCRRLCFLENQVYFQCNSIRCMESIWTPSDATDSLYKSSPLYMFDPSHNPIPFPDGRVGDDPEELPVLIDTYTERELGFQSDALNAFEGILKRFASAERPVYHIWGIPIFTAEAHILDRPVAGLLWRLRFDGSVLDSSRPEQRRAAYSGTMRRRLFPSWSWVDWDGRCLVRSGFRIWTTRIYDLVQTDFHSFVTLSMELGNGHKVLHAHEDGPWSPKSEYHECVKEECIVLERGVLTDDWVPKLSALELHPPILRLVGYTCDAVLWIISELSSEKGEPMHEKVKEALNSYRHAFRFSGGETILAAKVTKKCRLTDWDVYRQRQATSVHSSPHIDITWVWTKPARTFLYSPLMGPSGVGDVGANIEHDLCRIADGLCNPSGDLPSSPLKKEYHFRVIILGYTEKEAEFMVLIRFEGSSHSSETYERVNTIQRVNLLPEYPDMSIPEAMKAGLLEGWKMMETRIV